jgi:fluoride ion exporter CrcB/FEX
MAKRGQQSSFIGELWKLLRARKKYWMMPIIITLLLLGVLVFLSGTAAAPFIYTLF